MSRRCVLLLLLVACAGCVSPEARRTRGGGPGADVGNRSGVVDMHEESRPFWNTPIHVPLADPASDRR